MSSYTVYNSSLLFCSFYCYSVLLMWIPVWNLHFIIGKINVWTSKRLFVVIHHFLRRFDVLSCDFAWDIRKTFSCNIKYGWILSWEAVNTGQIMPFSGEVSRLFSSQIINAALVHCSKTKVRNGYNMEPLKAVSSLNITSNPNVQKQNTNNNDVTRAELSLSSDSPASYWSSHTSCRKEELTGVPRGQWPRHPSGHSQTWVTHVSHSASALVP